VGCAAAPRGGAVRGAGGAGGGGGGWAFRSARARRGGGGGGGVLSGLASLTCVHLCLTSNNVGSGRVGGAFLFAVTVTVAKKPIPIPIHLNVAGRGRPDYTDYLGDSRSQHDQLRIAAARRGPWTLIWHCASRRPPSRPYRYRPPAASWQLAAGSSLALIITVTVGHCGLIRASMIKTQMQDGFQGRSKDRAVRDSLKLVYFGTLNVFSKALLSFFLAKLPAVKACEMRERQSYSQPRTPKGRPSRGGNRRSSRPLPHAAR